MDKISFISGADIQIGGEVGKYNTIPIDFLVKIVQNLQGILMTIAKHDVPTDEAIDLNNFMIELSGFRKGSAVPQFVFTQRVQQIIGAGVDEQRELVNEKFNRIMEVSNRGEYSELQEMYPEPMKRNHIVEGIYKLTSDFGDTPVAFVDYTNKEPKPIYEVKKLKPKVRKKLLTEILEHTEIEEGDVQFGVAKVKLTTKTGKKLKSPAIQEVYYKGTISLDYAPDVIVAGKTVYNLTHPLRCLFEKEDDYYVIKAEMIDIIGTGETEDEAEKNFAEEFDFIYKRYNELPENKLSERIKIIKIFLNYLVKSVE